MATAIVSAIELPVVFLTSNKVALELKRDNSNGNIDRDPNHILAQDGHRAHGLRKRSPAYYANHVVSLVHSPLLKAIGKKKALKGLAKKNPLLKKGGKMSKKIGKGLFLFGLKPSVGHNTFWKTKLAKLIV